MGRSMVASLIGAGELVANGGEVKTAPPPIKLESLLGTLTSIFSSGDD